MKKIKMKYDENLDNQQDNKPSMIIEDSSIKSKVKSTGYHSEVPNFLTGKISNDKNIIYGFVMIVMMILLLMFFTSCSKKVEFLQSSVVPAAQGYIHVNTDDNNNYAIEVHVSDLAEIGRLQPSKKGYVVWAQTDEGNVENIGQLTSSSSFFSSQMEATLRTVSSYKPKKIFITAENSINVQDPSSFVVLSTEEF